MEIVELTSDYATALKPLFTKSYNYMGTNSSNFSMTTIDGVNMNPDAEAFNTLYYDLFAQAYLTGLSNYRAFGSFEDGIITSTIATYESIDSAEWYWTQIRSINSKAIPAVLDAVADYNELHGRLKFYSLFNAKYAKTYRRLAFSKRMQDRYGYFDEFLVPDRHKCIYTSPWQILFGRTLLPVDTVMRCTYLKQEYRTILPIAGAL